MRARGRKVVAVAVGAVLAVFLTVPTAVAAPPSNDDVRNAQVIARVPSSVAVDTREATTDPDTHECVLGNSVWYRFHAERGFTGHVLTSNSDSDSNSVIAIHTGQPNALTLLECTLVGAIEFQFLSGHTYYIAVSTCCDPSLTEGGRAVLHLYEPKPFTFSAPTTRAQAGDVSGTAIVRGTLRCVNPNRGTWIILTVSVTLRQRIGSHVVRGRGTTETLCTAKTRRWTIVMDGDMGLAFRPGRVRMRITKTATDRLDNTVSRIATRTVRLRKAPNLLADSTS